MDTKYRPIKGWFAAFGFLLCAIAWAPAMAEDILSKAVNDPSVAWSVYGSLAKAELIQDAKVTGGVAERVSIRAKADHPWDAGASSSIIKPVSAGDVLLLAFWAKANTLPAGAQSAAINAKIQENAPPYVGLGSDTPIEIGTEWKLYYASGTAARAYGPGSLTASLQLATAEQSIDFGPIFVLNFGPQYDTTKLPHN